jgi:hypothetical protein
MGLDYCSVFHKFPLANDRYLEAGITAVNALGFFNLLFVKIEYKGGIAAESMVT